MDADDEKKVIKALKALKVKPKADTAEDCCMDGNLCCRKYN